MADVHGAIAFVLLNEDGFVDNPNDSGGATNFGLSLRFLRQIPEDKLRKYGIFTAPELLSLKDIKDLTSDQAWTIYEQEFWKENYSKIAPQVIANHLFDMCVLHGENQAIKILQRAFWALAYKKDLIKDDGIFGEMTLGMVNEITYDDHKNLLSCMLAERAGYMRLLCVENPKNKEFLDGWLNRCYRI
jgi:lysozyme family protein